MVFAPRSWPSSPGFATTTRYGRFTNSGPYCATERAASTGRVGDDVRAQQTCRVVRAVRARSPLQRAVLPVAGGLLFFVVLGLLMWAAAALIAGSPEDVNERLATTTFEVGDVDSLSSIIAEEGPLIFPDLVRTGGTRTVVLDHTGDAPRNGWQVYFAYPADRDLTC